MAKRFRTHLGGDDMSTSGLKPKHLTRQEFGRRLYRLMIEKGWTQSELARQAGVQRDSVSTYINGRSLPSPGNLEKLANALGVPADDLLPNYTEQAIDEDIPDIELRRSASDPSHAWLRINRLVPYSVGIQILQLLDDQDAVVNGN